MNNIYRDRDSLKIVEWSVILFFVLFYPMFVSIYPILPPLFGMAGLIIIYTINKNIIYTISTTIYLVHLDLNLGLPFMLSVFSILIINTFIYPSVKLVIRCRVCLGLLVIILVDVFYYINLFIYDFILNRDTVVADSVLSFYIFIDMIIGLLL